MSLFKSHSRPQWSSNFVYILAAIGCSAGLGNLWRFSMLAYENGGGAFILALLLSNVLIVFPLVMMETIIGQKSQLGGPQSFEKIRPKTSWIQWLPVFALIVLMFYYAPILAWGIKYLVTSFSGAFLANPEQYFITDILHLTGGITDPGTFQWGLLLGVLAGYGLVLYALRKNVMSLGPVVKITATAPFLLLLLLIIRGVTLPGAIDGLEALFVPKWETFLDIKLWQAAVGQSFFSASLAMGYFFIAGSHRKEKAEIAKTTLWVLMGNFGVSILCGIAVFSTLGFMAFQQGVPVSEAAAGGPMLVFSVLPTAVSMMPWGAIFFSVLLFLVVITLAIDSIFGIFEVVAGAFHDLWHKTKYFHISLIVALILTLGCIPYIMGAGMYYLDITDHFFNYILLLVGLLETLVLAYVIGANQIRHWINHTAKGLKIGKWFNVMLYLIPFICAFLISVTLYKETQEVYGGYPFEYIVYWGFIPVAIIITLSVVFGIITHRKMKKHGLLTPLFDKFKKD